MVPAPRDARRPRAATAPVIPITRTGGTAETSAKLQPVAARQASDITANLRAIQRSAPVRDSRSCQREPGRKAERADHSWCTEHCLGHLRWAHDDIMGHQAPDLVHARQLRNRYRIRFPLSAWGVVRDRSCAADCCGRRRRKFAAVIGGRKKIRAPAPSHAGNSNHLISASSISLAVGSLSRPRSDFKYFSGLSPKASLRSARRRQRARTIGRIVLALVSENSYARRARRKKRLLKEYLSVPVPLPRARQNRQHRQIRHIRCCYLHHH